MRQAIQATTVAGYQSQATHGPSVWVGSKSKPHASKTADPRGTATSSGKSIDGRQNPNLSRFCGNSTVTRPLCLTTVTWLTINSIPSTITATSHVAAILSFGYIFTLTTSNVIDAVSLNNVRSRDKVSSCFRDSVVWLHLINSALALFE